jgi:hypothetical protein
VLEDPIVFVGSSGRCSEYEWSAVVDSLKMWSGKAVNVFRVLREIGKSEEEGER